MTADTRKNYEMLTEKLKEKKKKEKKRRNRRTRIIFSWGTKSSINVNNFAGQDGKYTNI